MRQHLLCIAAILAFAFPVAAKPDNTTVMKENERKLLLGYLEEARDSLQRMITRQYTLKQQYVEQREADKNELDKLRDEQMKRENELSRIKEERLSRESALADERKGLTDKQDEWKYSKEQVTSLFQKEADGLVEVFPTDRERRRLELEGVRSEFASTGSPSAAFVLFVKYHQRWFHTGDSSSIVKAPLMPEESGPRALTIARFGNVLGYGIDTAGAPFYIRQTGRLGAEKFIVEKIAAPQVAGQLASLIPEWARTGAITGGVPLEVLQNEHARMLISGKKESYWTGLYHSLEKGGWIMIPMLLLIPWVLVLTGVKIVQYASISGALSREHRTVTRHFLKADFDAAMTFAKAGKPGLVAKMTQACVERRSIGRIAGERAIGELITLEMPRLNRSLNTLAVIAGAAPLLGLLGTISGMITLFAAVTHYGTGDPKFLAGGISEALITAKTGLSIAIPVLFIHDLLRGAKDHLVADIEKRAISILHAVFPEG
jgi:biopolymer transport protein ExbB